LIDVIPRARCARFCAILREISMNPFLPCIAIGLLVLASGCVQGPKINPVDADAERRLQVGKPFVYQTEPEPIDIGVAHSSLDIAQCLRLALEHDPRIQSALARVRQAEADARQTRLLPNPVIGVSLRFPEHGGKSIIDADLSAELLSLLTRPGRVSAADSRLRKVSSEALATVLDVATEVQRQYADVLALRGRIEVEEARRSNLQQIARITDARVKAGEAARLDGLVSQSTLAELETDLIALRSKQRIARLKLARLIGQPSRAIDWTLMPWGVPALPEKAESDWITIALQHRPELLAVQWELAALGQEVKLAKIEPWTGELGAAAERDGDWSVGPSASVSIPIFDTGDIARAKRQAMVIEQKHELTRLSRQIVEEVRTALEQTRAAAELLDRTQGLLIPLEEQKLKQAQDSYRVGLSDAMTLRLAEQDAQDARSKLIELQTQQLEARFDLDRAVGGSGAYTTIATENK